MKRLGLILAIVIIAIGAWFDWTYRSVRTEIAELQSGLPSEEEFDRMSGAESAERLKLAVADCRPVASLKWKIVGKLFDPNDIATLAERCELIESRAASQGGP